MDDLGLQSKSFPFDRYLTVRGLLCTHYGMEHGDEIYELLLRTASAAAAESGEGMKPGVLFNDDGGEFVGLQEE